MSIKLTMDVVELTKKVNDLEEKLFRLEKMISVSSNNSNSIEENVQIVRQRGRPKKHAVG